MFHIRQEIPLDYVEVYKLVKHSFDTTSYSDGTEADYLNDVRKKNTFIPELSLIAEDDAGKIVGQIVLYKTFIETKSNTIPALVLSPISVHPDYFRKGIASAMIDKAFMRAAKLGYIAVFLCGEPEIYCKLGFIPSYEFEIFHKNDFQAEWCMAKELISDSLSNISGIIDIV